MLKLNRITLIAGFLLIVAIAFSFAENQGTPMPPGAPGKAELTKQQAAEISEIMADPAVKQAKVSALVKNLRTGQVLYSKNEKQLVIPASTNKLITGAAALNVLGTNYQFKTEVFADRRPDESGTVRGNLYIVGGGDPNLSVEEVYAIAHGIRIAGVKSVTGDLVGDDSFHDQERFYADWGDQGHRAYHASLGALSVNWNTVTFWVRPGPKPGTPAVVTIDPLPKDFPISGTINTVDGAKSSCYLNFSSRQATISGSIGVDAIPGPTSQAVAEPLTMALGLFREMLNKEGITVTGQSRAGLTPSGAALIYEHKSEELSLILRRLYRFSNNFTAEQILRTLGAVKYGKPGSREKGGNAVVDWLRQEKLYQDGVAVFDGSGLSRENRESAASMTGVLEYMYHNVRVFPEYLDAQPIAGVDGTLRKRFKHTNLVGRVRAKTGLLNGVISLAGYSYDTRGELYAFAVLINDYSPTKGVRGPQGVTEELLEVLMQ